MASTARFPDLEGVSVLITGGGSGIGAELTSAFVRQGAKVAFIDIAADPSNELCDRLDEETGRRPLYLNADLRDIEALRAAIAAVAKTNGPITVLVNNAAYDQRHRIADVTVDYWDANQAINLRPAFFAAQAVAPGMKAAGGGAIINFTSISYMLNMGDMPSYTSAKAGVVGLTKGLAGELGVDNIRVNAIAPGWIMTERQKNLWVTEEALNKHVDRQCLKRVLEPVDIVGPCLFFASSASQAMTAQILIVDGGVL